jgi:tripartite-type tricarboxylate transporter receptor subunit TctC
MVLLRTIKYMLSVAMCLLGTSVACAQSYPNKPIRIVTVMPGGPNDFAARVVAQGISGPIGQPVIVDNRPSNLMVDIVAKAPPDGYTLLLSGNVFMFGPLLRTVSYDPIRDFLPISTLYQMPNVLVVNPALPARSVKELIALAKAKPGELNYGFAGAGGSLQLAAELFKALAGVNIVGVNYKGAAAGVTGVMSGEVQVMFADAGVMEQVKSGKLRALAVTSPQPSALAPDLPTVAATGLPGYQYVSISGIWAPARTPEAAINRLNQELVRLLSKPEVKTQFAGAGAEAIASSPAQFAAAISASIAAMDKVIKGAGIKVE